MKNKQTGFSLVETLVAMLLFAVASLGLMHYQQLLAQGFMAQWQQREAWRLAVLRLEGYEKPGWHSQLIQQTGPAGCHWVSAEVQSPLKRQATVRQLRCDKQSH